MTRRAFRLKQAFVALKLLISSKVYRFIAL